MTGRPFWIPGSREDARPGMTVCAGSLWARLALLSLSKRYPATDFALINANDINDFSFAWGCS